MTGMTQTLAALARNVRALRYSSQLSQEDLAERLGVTVQTVSGVERGVRKPSLDIVVGLALVFEVEVSELFSTKGEAWVVARALDRRSRNADK